MKKTYNRLTWEDLLTRLADDRFILSKETVISPSLLPIVPEEYMDNDCKDGKILFQTNKGQYTYRLIYLFHATTYCLCKMWSLYDMVEPVGLKEVEAWYILGTKLIPDPGTRAELQRMMTNLTDILWEIEEVIFIRLSKERDFRDWIRWANNPKLFFTRDLNIVVCES